MKKLLEIMAFISFALAGCGVDSIFDSEESFCTWIIIVIAFILCVFILWGNKDESRED